MRRDNIFWGGVLILLGVYLVISRSGLLRIHKSDENSSSEIPNNLN